MSRQTVTNERTNFDLIILLSTRPTDRTSDDLDIIFSKLKDVKALEKFHPLLVQQLCYYSYFESLEKGVTRKHNERTMIDFNEPSLRVVFRTGDLGANWFAILSGTVDVCVPSENGKVSVIDCLFRLSCRWSRVIHWSVPWEQEQPLVNRFSTIHREMPRSSRRPWWCCYVLNNEISKSSGR